MVNGVNKKGTKKRKSAFCRSAQVLNSNYQYINKKKMLPFETTLGKVDLLFKEMVN